MIIIIKIHPWPIVTIGSLFMFFFVSVKKAAMVLNCSHSRDRLDIPRLTVTAILIFKCTQGAGVGDYSYSPLRTFDTHARWQPVTRKVLDLDDLTEKQRTVNSLGLCCHTFFQRKKKEKENGHALALPQTSMPLGCPIQDGVNNDCQGDEEVEVDQLRSPFTDALILVADKCFG